MNQDGWISMYEKKGALWIHDGNVKRPHALLTSGKHSNGFFNSELVMEDSEMLDDAVCVLQGLLIKRGLDTRAVSRVVGPAMGAITLAHDITRWLSQSRVAGEAHCLRAYTEKEEAKFVIIRKGSTLTVAAAELKAEDIILSRREDKAMVFKRTAIKPGEQVLLCEDVLTTGGSVDLATRAVEEAGGIVLPFVVVLVNRSGLVEVGGKQIVALIDRPMPMWSPDECPLCKQGSEAIKPKGKENWVRLNASY